MSFIHPQNIAAILEERGVIKEGERYDNKHLMNVIEKVANAVEALGCITGTYQMEAVHAFSIALGFEHNNKQQAIFSALFQAINDMAEDKMSVDGRNQYSKDVCDMVHPLLKEGHVVYNETVLFPNI